MSLQELRDTLFNYMGPIVYDHFLGPEHKSRNQQFIRFYDNPWTPNWDKDGEYVYYPVYSFTKTEIDSNAPAGQYDHILTSLLGGRGHPNVIQMQKGHALIMISVLTRISMVLKNIRAL